VPVKTDPAFSVETPKTLFRGAYVSDSGMMQWDISADGKRFLMMKAAASETKAPAAGSRRINVVLNWLEELKQRVPVK